MDNWIFYNDEFLPADKPVLQAGNRLLQYGDGLFETMRVWNGRIVLEEYHFERLYSGMQALMLDGFNKDQWKDAVLRLCAKNELMPSSRVRLSVFRHRGIIIESWPLESGYVFSADGFTLDVFQDVKKSIDLLSQYKTAAYLPYALAAVFSRKHGFNDCLVTNAREMVCDSSIANVFCVKHGEVFTPSLNEGCINGVMRRHIMNHFPVKERSIDLTDISNADEVFLTNVIRGVQPVTSFREANYQTAISSKIFETLVKPLTER